MEVNTLVNKALNNLNKEKQEIESRIALINSIDWSKPITEDEWHELCETSIRGSDLLKIAVQNIFPSATDIVLWANAVNFMLYGYKVQIPTSRCRGINIATNWYRNISWDKEHRHPAHSKMMLSIREYYNAVDNKFGWKAEAKSIIPEKEYRNDFELWMKWFLCGHRISMKTHNRTQFENMWLIEEEQYNARTLELEEIERENKRHLEFIVNTLIPELDKFSTAHYAYHDGMYHKTVKELCEKEGIPYAH